jgi:hypothetical protein
MVLAMRTILFGMWSVAMRRAVWTTVARGVVSFWWWTITPRWSFATHVSRTFISVATGAVAWWRTFFSPTSASLFAIAARTIVATIFGTGMTVPFFAIPGRWTHFVAITTAWTVEIVTMRRAIETSIG